MALVSLLKLHLDGCRWCPNIDVDPKWKTTRNMEYDGRICMIEERRKKGLDYKEKRWPQFGVYWTW